MKSPACCPCPVSRTRFQAGVALITVLLIVFLASVAAVSLASILGGTRLSTEVVACFCADLRADVFRKVNTLSFEEFGSLGTAALVTRATHDVDTVSWVASMLSGSGIRSRQIRAMA